MKSLVSEMNTTMDHLSLLRKNAFAYLLRRVNESINGEEPYQTTEGPRGRSLSIGEKKNN